MFIYFFCEVKESDEKVSTFNTLYILWKMIHTSCVKELFHTTTKRQTGYSRFVILISTILITKHSFFLKISLTLLPNALLSPPEFSALPLPDLSSWSHGSLSPEGFFSIEVWSLKELGFESVGVWKCWFQIWFGFKDLGFIWVWE